MEKNTKTIGNLTVAIKKVILKLALNKSYEKFLK